MSSGGGTTTQVSTTELPSWLQDAAQGNLARADYVSKLGYVPQYGLDVAGFTPMQQSAMQNTANAASAFGLSAPTDAMAGMPAQQTNNLGFSGYSSGNLFDAALSQLAQNRPAQYDAINAQFIDPYTGDLGVNFMQGGDVVVNPNAQYTTPVYNSSTGNYEATSQSDMPAGYLTNNTLLPTWAEDLALSGANLGPVGTFLSPVSKMLGSFFIDQQMDNIKDQFGVYNSPDYKTGTAVMTDKNGAQNLVDLSQYSSPISGGGSTIYSGQTGGGVGSSYSSSAGYNWDDYGGYTGVTGTGSNMGNDWGSFGGSDTTSVSYSPSYSSYGSSFDSMGTSFI